MLHETKAYVKNEAFSPDHDIWNHVQFHSDCHLLHLAEGESSRDGGSVPRHAPLDLILVEHRSASRLHSTLCPVRVTGARQLAPRLRLQQAG